MNRPNILMITCHDIGRHLGCYGVETVQTGNIDRLAERGVRFDNLYSTSAVCSPARGSLHTGRYPQSNGLMGLTHTPWWWRLNDGERHTAAILADAGYRTALIGFNHIDPENPARLGYQRLLSTGCLAEETVQATGELIREARPGERPFFAKVGFTEVHRPFTRGSDTRKGVFVPPWLRDSDQVRDDLAAFQETIRHFDQSVGAILEMLERSRVAGNTLVIFTSDHGIPYPGAKWTVRKAGIEIPLVLYQPGTLFSGGKVFSEIMSNVDILPTLLEYVGLPVPASIQGVSFMDRLAGKQGGDSAPPRTQAYAQYTPEMKRDNTSRSVIGERYHLIRYFEAGRTVAYPVDVHPQRFAAHQQRCPTAQTRPFAQLYDIKNDPYELHDVGADPENAAVLREMSRDLLAWMREVNDPLLRGPVRTPYYERAVADLLAAVGGEE